MNKFRNNNRTADDELAAFTDEILGKRTPQDKDPFSPDPDLRALQQTVLHLKNTHPDDEPSEAAIQRMRQNIVAQWKQRASLTRAPFWKRFFPARKPASQKWQSLNIRRRKSLAIYLATAVLVLFVSILLLKNTGLLQPAASGQNLNAGIFIAFGGLILLALWFFVRKR